MGWFSRNDPPSNCKDCNNPCKQRFQERQALIQAAREKAAREGGTAGAEAAATANRFESYNRAMPRAKAAKDVYDPGKEPCLRRITDPKELARLGLKPEDLRDDGTGFHAEVYQSEWDGSTIVAYQGTDPNSLHDWKTNIDNGRGLDTAQYAQARSVAAKMNASGANFDIAGHSLGGGLASEGGLMAPGHNVYTFNSAGLSNASLGRTGASSFADLDSRTQAFRTERDFLTGIQEARAPGTQLANAQGLRNEITGQGGWMNPMEIKGYNSETNEGAQYLADRQSFLNDVDGVVSGAQADVAAGRDPGLFPEARGQRTNVPGLTGTSSILNDRLSRLNQHTMDSMLSRMEEQKKADEKALKNYTGQGGFFSRWF